VSGRLAARIASAAVLTGFVAAAQAAGDGRPLRIVAIDVEGGAATLYVTPQGHSLLIDSGWPAGMGGGDAATSSAQRIVTAAKAADVTRIDYLLISHYHADHVGGTVELLSALPVGTVIDHGPNREPIPQGADLQRVAGAAATLYPKYLEAIGSRPHRVMRPGETLEVDDMTVTAVDSDAKILGAPLPGGGARGNGCADATTSDEIGGEENQRSLGVLISWGRARILSLADTTWNVENRLVCPRNLIGRVDLMFADNHGSDNANSPVLVNTVQPRVVVFSNGPTKGAGPRSYATAVASGRIEAVWQIHFAEQHPDRNARPAHVANLAGESDAMHPLRIAVLKNADLTITNPRTGASFDYPR
jgi:competence protein ComEC